MLSQFSIGTRITTAMVAVLIVTVGVITPVSVSNLRDTISTAEGRELQNLFKNVNASIQSESRLAKALSEFVAHIPSVQQAMADNDRESLAAMLVPPFKIMKKDYGVRQFQFHKAPATSFLRVHKPQKFGDDLSSFRHTVVETNQNRVNISGIEKGVAGLGVRGVVPMYNNGEHTGSVEFGMSFGQPFFETFKKLYGVDLGLYIFKGEKFEKFAATMDDNLLSHEQLQKVYQGEQVRIQTEYKGVPVAVLGGVITDFSNKPIGVLEIIMDRSGYVSSLNTAMYSIVMVGALCLILGIGLAWLITRAIVHPIKSIANAMHDISDGEGDLTQRLEVNGKDEIAHLASGFNLFSEKVRALVVDVSGSTMQLSSAAEEMSLITDGSNRSISTQRSEIDQVATAMNEMTATVQEVARNASAAAESASQADNEATQGRLVVGNSVSSINALAGEVERAAEVINKVEQDSESIGTVLDVIRGIAEQTNLLALNAAIEAARAGEQGRGFAVVADEVRTLASRTQSSTQEIQGMIERLQSGAQDAVKVMQQGREMATESVSQAEQAGVSLETITRAISEINDMNTQIASAAEEQSSVAEEINSNVVNINSVADEVTEGAAQTATASAELARLASDLQMMVARFKT